MTDRELMKQALEALEGLADTSWTAAFKQREYDSDEPNENVERERVLGVITALRERLAQPEQEPSADEVIASHAKRLALTLEALLLSCEETAVVSKWWSSAHMALGQYQDDIDRLYPQDHISPLGKD